MFVDNENKKILINKEEKIIFYLHMLGLNGDNKIKVYNYIVSNINEKSVILESQRKIAEKIGVSYPIVSAVFVCLVKKNILKKVSNTQYILLVDITKFTFEG